MIVYSDSFIMPDFQPDNQPAKKRCDFGARPSGRFNSQNNFGVKRAKARAPKNCKPDTTEKSSNVSRFQASNRCATRWNHNCCLPFGVGRAKCAGANGIVIL